MIKNYFSDITDLFLKVKNEENIQIDETAKAQIRSILANKIATIKAPEESSTPSFWSTWKYQLFGIPASVFALLLITFTASNFSSIKTQPKTQPEKIAIVESVIESGTESKIEQENDRPLVKTAQKLVIDYGENAREERSLNKISTIKKDSTATIATKEILETSKVENADIADTTNNKILVLNEPEKQEEPGEEEESVKTEIKPEKIIVIAEKTPSLEDDIPSDKPEKIVEPVIAAVIEPEPVLTIAQVAAPITSLPIDSPIYVYKDEELKTQPAFSEEKLAKLTRSQTPESITVYYVEDKHVVVEIEENEVTKWYLFDNLDGNWTMSKYEKYDSKDVVK